MYDKGKNISAVELERQQHYAEKMRTVNDEFFNRTGKRKTMFISTYGCQMNAHDSEKIYGILTQMGYEPADEEKDADFIIYNTCCVRENAENKVYGNLGYLKHAKKANPDMRIALCGCMMQQESVLQTIKQKYRQVDIVFGTFNLYKLPELIYINYETNQPVFDIWKEHGEIIEDLPTIRKSSFKASVNIMFGCNNFCSYCIVPYVRGRERSRSSADIIKEIKSLAAAGTKEITLLGQNVNSYGKNLTGEDEGITFARLLRMVNDIDGIERIRFMTSHPKDLSDELIKAMQDCDKVCRHIHLPFQAGNNEILKRMNRHYTKEDYLALTDKIKAALPGIAITTDIIVGFPGETAQQVDDTIDVIKKVRFNSAFTFIYSKRMGTPAAAMENQVPEKEAKKNFNRVLEALNPIIYELNSQKVGKTYDVLADGISSGDDGLITGRLEDNSLVHFKADSSVVGSIVSVKITDCKTFYLMGELM